MIKANKYEWSVIVYRERNKHVILSLGKILVPVYAGWQNCSSPLHNPRCCSECLFSNGFAQRLNEFEACYMVTLLTLWETHTRIPPDWLKLRQEALNKGKKVARRISVHGLREKNVLGLSNQHSEQGTRKIRIPSDWKNLHETETNTWDIGKLTGC